MPKSHLLGARGALVVGAAALALTLIPGSPSQGAPPTGPPLVGPAIQVTPDIDP